MTTPAPHQTAALLAEAQSAEARVRRGVTAAHSGFLTTLGLVSSGYFLAQPIAGDEPGVLAATAVFVAAVLGAVLALLLGQGSTRYGFSRRFGGAMGAWAVVFTVGLAVGTTTAPYSWTFWSPLAALVAVPCLIGAWRELPR